MSEADIHALITDFYEAISFGMGETPQYNAVFSMFDSSAILINNSFAKPLRFTPEEFVQGLESNVAAGDTLQYLQREIFSKTEVFGKVAQRLSVYEYNFAEVTPDKLPQGINFIQFVQAEGLWRIASMVWSDENENHLVPEEYLK